ncbi:MAG: hypothetical protein ACYCO5_01760 [Acidobacteriaceae bacterium]
MRCFRSKGLPGRCPGRWLRQATVAGCVLAGLACAQVWAQQTSTPSLQHRSGTHPDQGGPGADNSAETAGQPSSLPNDVWGAYEFDHSNDSIELDLDRNKLSGYITQLGDAETDNNTPLTFFFDQSSIDGGEISFQTRVVHGVWYSFRGTIDRGDGKSRGDEGYYVLRGVLAVHHPQSGRDKSADEIIEKRRVHFKSMPQ